MMSAERQKKDSMALAGAATRLLKASALGRSVPAEDLEQLRAAADPEAEGLTPDELACHILLREIRWQRQVD